MKNLFIGLFILITATLAQAQNDAQGQVINAATGETVVFATIYFPQLEKGTITDESGKFTVNDLPKGRYKIVVSFVGFETFSSSIDIPIETDLIFKLTPSAIEMQEVILSTPFHKLQRDNVMKVEQEKVTDLKANGMVTLADGITEIAGVSNLSTGIGISKPVIRGLSSNRVLVYTQGVRLENQQYGDEHGLGVNDAGIESIEVIKGPASLLYGSDALGGVLYLNPERFAAPNTSRADGSYNFFSNTQGYNTNLAYKSSSDNFKVILRGSLAEHADYETADYRVTNTRFKEQDLKAALGYQKTSFKSEFRYNLNTLQTGIPEEIGDQNTNTTPLLPNQNITNHIFSSKSTWFLNNSSLTVNLGYTYNDRKEFEDHHHHEDEVNHEDEDHDDEHEDEDEDHDEEEEILEAALRMKLKTFSYNIQYDLPRIGKFETIVGVQGMNQVNTNYGEEILIPNARTNDVGILATSHIHFDKIDVQLGARYDNRSINIDNVFSRSYNSFNGAIGAKTDLSKNLLLRVNLASGFRAPNLAELASDGTHEGTNRYEIGNANLNNEQNVQVDVALEFNNEHFEVFANGFYNTINDYIFLSPDGTEIDNTPVFRYLQDNAQLYGGEFGIHAHPHPLDWLHIESSFETVVGKLDNSTYLPLIPANQLRNTVRFEFGSKWFKDASAFVRMATIFDQNNVNGFETATPGYNLFNAGLQGEIRLFKNPLSISVSGTNLFNKRYISHLSRLKPEGILNMGRNISIGLNYKIG